MKPFRAAAAILLAATLPLLADDYSKAVKTRIVVKTTVTSNGEPVRYPVTDRAEVTAAEVEIPVGGETGFHLHPGPVYAWVVSGQMTVEAQGGATKAYGPGDPIVEMTGVPHNGRNTGTVPVKMLVFYLGEQGKPVTKKTAE